MRTFRWIDHTFVQGGEPAKDIAKLEDNMASFIVFIELMDNSVRSYRLLGQMPSYRGRQTVFLSGWLTLPGCTKTTRCLMWH